MFVLQKNLVLVIEKDTISTLDGIDLDQEIIEREVEKGTVMKEKKKGK